MKNTRMVNGITFVSEVTNLNNMRPSDMLAIAYCSILEKNNTESIKVMADSLKAAKLNYIEISRDEKYKMTFTAKAI